MTSNNPVWILGDGGPNIILSDLDFLKWEGALNFDNSLMQGSKIRTHYDAACEFNEWIFSFNIDSISGLSLSGDDVAASWFINDRNELGIIRPLMSDHELLSEYCSDLNLNMLPISELEYRILPGRYYLMVGADVGSTPIYRYSAIEIPYLVNKIITFESKVENSHIIVHEFRS